MRIIVFKTENAVFEFSRKDILEHLNLLATEHDGDETVRLGSPLSRSFFEFLLLSLFSVLLFSFKIKFNQSTTSIAKGKLMMAHPFMPMTNEMIKKLTRMMQDSDQTINLTDLSSVFVSQESKSALELNPQHSEADHSDIST